MAPQVSVIIPAYNAGGYLRECLDSVLGQTLADLEVIVVDDASTDDSWEILGQYAARDPRIVPLRHAANRLQGAARNTGVAGATGRYLGFVDSDDWIAPAMYETLWKTAEEGAYEIVSCGLECKSPEGSGEEFIYSRDLEMGGGVEGLTAVADQHWMTGPCNKIFRRDFFLRHDIRFVEQGFYEDVLPTMESVYHARRLRVIPEIFYYYRRHERSTTNQLVSAVLCTSRYRLYREIEAFFSSLDHQDGMKEIGRRILDQFGEYTCANFMNYLCNHTQNAELQADDPVIREGSRHEPLARRLLHHLTARNAHLLKANGMLQNNYQLLEQTLLNLRDGGEGVRNHFRYLLRAVARRFQRSLSGGPNHS